MDVETALKEVDEAVATEVGGEDEAFRKSFKTASRAVDSAAGGDAVEDLTRFVAGHVREHGERPAPAAVDQRAAEIIREHGEEIPENSYLQNA